MTRTSPIGLCLLLALLTLPACHRPPAPVQAPPRPTFVRPPATARVLIVAETEGPGGAAAAEAAQDLTTLVAHFDERCDVAAASDYEPGAASAYQWCFYLAGKPDVQARRQFAADLADNEPTAVWVGPGVNRLSEIGQGLGLTETDGESVGAEEWAISYRERTWTEQVTVPPVRAGEDVPVLASAERGDVSRPFLVGSGRLWYAAAAPSLERHRFWTCCIWADALHEIMGRPHEDAGRRLVPILRDVPVWTTSEQAPRVVRAMREAGLPVGVTAWTKWGEVPLADRPEAVEGLRAAESLGAALVLVADSKLDSREHFRLAWEVGLHPVAWAGPVDGRSIFRLRVAEPDKSPPYCAGGLLPAPLPVSDAGLIAPDNAERLRMLEVVRDAVALVSFGLWAPAEPFAEFVAQQRGRGWRTADVREFGVRVEDSRRVLLSGPETAQVPAEATARTTTFSREWAVLAEGTAPGGGSDPVAVEPDAPPLGVTAVELVRELKPGPFIKGVTLDPAAYRNSAVSSRELAEMVADRCARHDVNTVFFYAYNVEEGAAYRTRYSGATVSEWGREDLLAHLLEACHARDIRVVAWMYSGRDRGMWKKHPEWRERTKDGRAHNPLRLHAAYFLCPRNPEVRRWFAGLLRDLARRYPTLDGIELCEPVVNWFGDQACYCAVCREEFADAHPAEPLGGPEWRRFRAEGLTGFLSECIGAVSEQGIDTYIMTICDAWSNGAILPARRQAEESGFDLDAVLDGPHPPDWVNFEIIWQQWAAIYGDEVFNDDWAEETARRLARRTDARARVLFHVELTDFGPYEMTAEKIAATMERVSEAQPDGIECYHSRALDRKAAWSVLANQYRGMP